MVIRMELKIGELTHNFCVKNIRSIPESDATLVEMVYEKTGTPLCWVNNGDSNKLFCVAFETLPEDSTGVFHILEHSVLCGSEKYPVKEPFVELLKSSMNTFLNAMTYPDKTVYPVSSRNDRDFLNLAGVYLDAVFAPKILTEPNIFYQEGWHYEQNGDELVYNGVVFNEMKGAMSSVDTVAYHGIQSLLFPDSIYHFVSGGAPENIPDLTYEQFIATYRKNYHPSNAKIYLDGDVPLDDVLAMLDEYLSRFEKGEAMTLSMQTPVSAEATIQYEAVSDGTPKAQLVIGKIISDFEDKTKQLAASVLGDVLCGSNDAPLTRALLEAGLCRDVSIQIESGIAQPFMILRLQNMDESKIDDAKSVIRSVCERLLNEGIEKSRFTASVNRLSYRLRQMQEPQGLVRCVNALDSWLYGGDPIKYLHYDDSVSELRQMIEDDGFMPLLRELLLDEDGLCTLTVLPSETYGEETRLREAERLAKEKAAMSAEELEEVAERQKALDKWQQTGDTPEQLSTLPVLDLSEIDGEPSFTDLEKDECDGVTVLRHNAPTNGIVHLRAYFNLSDLTLDEIADAAFLTELLGVLPAGGMDSLTLQNEIKTYIGALDFDVSAFSKKGQRETCTPYFTVHCSVLRENYERAVELVTNILLSSDFNCPDRIREIVMQTEIEAEQGGMSGGHSLAASCTQAHYSSVNAVSEVVSGYSFIEYIHRFARNFDETLPRFLESCESIMKKAVCKKRLVLSITADDRVDASPVVSRLEDGSAAPECASYKTALPKKLGIKIPAQVSYAAVGYHLAEADMTYSGTARLVSNIISLNHLWNVVRVQNGAYGVGMRTRRNGGMFCYSYRDPSPAKTLKTWRDMSSFVKAYADSGESIDKFIISTVAETEPLVSAAQAGSVADSCYFTGFDRNDAAKERAALLSATPEDLKAFCKVLDRLCDGAVCVVGYAGALESCADEELTVVDI